MRIVLAGLLIAVPILAGTPAQAQNDILNQAQKFLGGGGNDQNAYERGRQDEMRRQQIDREHRREARDRERYYDDRRPANGYRDDGYRGR